MKPKDILNIDQLFDDVIQEKVTIEEKSKMHLKEESRLQILYKLDKGNIDDVFENVVNEDNYELEIEDAYINKQFGNRLVVGKVGLFKNSLAVYQVKCLLCSNITETPIKTVKDHPDKCGHCLKYPSPSLGDKFRKWTIINTTRIIKRSTTHYLCQCECGTIQEISYISLRMNRSSKCKKCAGTSTYTQEEWDEKSNLYSGKIYGTTKILGIFTHPKYRKIYADCLCNCGRAFQRLFSNIIVKNKTLCFVCSFSDTPKDPYIGQKFGRKTVINVINRKNITVQCECGAIKNTTYKDQLRFLKDNINTACVDCTRKDRFKASEYSSIHVGQKFGKRTIVDATIIRRNKVPCVKTICECGYESIIVLKGLLKSKNSRCLKCPTKTASTRTKFTSNLSGPKLKFRQSKIGLIIRIWKIINFYDESSRVKYELECTMCSHTLSSRWELIKSRKCPKCEPGIGIKKL